MQDTDRRIPKIKVIANRVMNEDDGVALFQKLNVVVELYLKLPMTYLGAIPQDSLLSNAVMQQMPVSIQHPNAKSALAYQKMAAALMNMETAGQVKKRGMAAFFSHIISGKKLG